ncbi:COG1470 family protein [Micromonospora endophytica]|uniref:Uncharacterized protein n=1 Tax=Micromonospora endophytica TaxID=515350 RepID=A0A2W2BUC7_9ACTN|nr:hypothetical protein [Micromonospora endophytica]PZF90845.1 hypothetical protein C1I93_22240 [Micromonospora endophytica]RIW41816.1 hypothetical protein D3H59_24780 [Micromonospora endophytica]BCJ56868.1 hypothetical protein Jiend_02900 [Micromonospora endophytica]
MTTEAFLDADLVEVGPGSESSCRLEIRNTGSIVESYAIEVLGEPADWTSVEPPAVTVYPGDTGTALVRFHPPRSAQVVAGDRPFAVRVTPTERPDAQVVPEATVRVLPFAAVAPEILPRTSHGRRTGRHEVSVANVGNIPLGVALSGSDPNNQLAFAIRPEVLTVAPGEAAFVQVRARSRKWLWRGQPVTRPFQVDVVADEVEPARLDAATVQQPVLPAGIGRVVAALLVLALLGAGLWYALLRPSVKSLAEEAAQEQVAPVAQQAQAADTRAQEAQTKADQAAAAVSAAPVAPRPTRSPSPTAGTGVPALPPGADSFSRRLAVTAPAGATRTDQYTVPARRVVVLTDIFLQNPQGDEGRLDLVIDGTTVQTVALQNFRDLDYHVVSPIEIPADAVVTLRVNCRQAGTALDGVGGGGGQCRDFALLNGYIRTVSRSPEP